MDSGMTRGLNAPAADIADQLADDAAAYSVNVRTLLGGARVIDAGVEAAGGFAAGLAMVHACMGGLGYASLVPLSIDGNHYHGVHVWTDHPSTACMASQYAGWALQVGDYFAMGSGPLRAVARVEQELFDKLGYAEQAERASEDAARSTRAERSAPAQRATRDCRASLHVRAWRARGWLGSAATLRGLLASRASLR